MKLIRLVATNFMPYKGEIAIDFPTADYANVMIVFGDNMRGKTSLLNALRWGFYGRAIGRHSRPIPTQQIVNKDAASEGEWRVEVFLTFEANGHRYELRRMAQRRALVAVPSKSEDFTTSVHLTRDGMVIAGDQVEAEINQAAPEQVSRFFLFDGELLQEYEELLIEHSEQGRQIKEAIEQVLGVPALTNGRAELGAILKAATKEQNADMAKVAGLERAAADSERLLLLLESREADLLGLQDKLVATRAERSQLDDELAQAATVLALKAQLDAARASASEHADVLRRKTTDRHSVLAGAWRDMLDGKLEVKRRILRDRQRAATATLRKRLEIEGAIKTAEKTIATRECPSCHQPYPERDREALGHHLGELEAELLNLGESVDDIQTAGAELEALDRIRGKGAHALLTAVDRDIRGAQVGQQKAENDVERIQDQIAGHDTADLARKRVLQQEKLKEEGRLTGDISLAREQIQRFKDQAEISRKSIEGLASGRSQRSTRKVAIASALERCFATSVEELRNRLRRRVETLASESFKAMTTQKAYRGLEINDNYGLNIVDSTGRPVSIRSAGAEQIVALSLIDGLNRTGRAIGPVVMDTPFGRLDPKHRHNIMRYLPTVTSQFVLLVHGGEIRPETDLAGIRDRIGAAYTIREISETQSAIERIAL